MADSMEVHAEEVGQPTDELVVQDPDFDGETEETNAADTGNEADSAGSAPSGDGQDSPQETAPEEKPKRRRAKQPAAKDASEGEGESEPADAGPARRRTKMEAAGDSGMSRAEVLRDARQREAERLIARQERERFLAGWSALKTAMRRHSIVNGVVSSVEIRHVGGPDEVTEDLVLLAVMLDGGYKVLVPLEEFYQENPVDMRTATDLDTAEGQRELTRRKRALAEKLYELQIPLIITDMEMNDRDENGAYDYAIVGSRRKALDIIEMQNFGAGRGGNQAINEGDMVPATITSVSIHGVAVVVGGVDTRIPMRLLTFRYLLDARTAYHVGQELLVYVNKIETLPNGRHEIEVSAKQAELQSARMRQKLLPVGTSTLGVITSVRPAPSRPDIPAGTLNITAYLKMYDMPAIVRGLPVAYLGRPPIAGDEVRLVVLGFTPAGFVVANCRSFNGAPGLLNH